MPNPNQRLTTPFSSSSHLASPLPLYSNCSRRRNHRMLLKVPTSLDGWDQRRAARQSRKAARVKRNPVNVGVQLSWGLPLLSFVSAVVGVAACGFFWCSLWALLVQLVVCYGVCWCSFVAAIVVGFVAVVLVLCNQLLFCSLE
ncbi:hypothetical protein U1Q18_034750 [Sarracenia purpurea var. burkii]